MAGMRTFPEEKQLFERARRLGGELCRCISEKQAFPNQEIFRAGFKERMSGLVEFMKDDWIFEHQFWARKSIGESLPGGEPQRQGGQ
jgi:hypothetical protein